jgi:hypothetical protein
MDMGIGGSSGASWTFDIKKRVMFFFKQKNEPEFLISFFF